MISHSPHRSKPRVPFSRPPQGAPAMTDLLAAALDYARRGWPVFPCHTPTVSGCSCGAPDCGDHTGKHPRTRHGFKDATTDPVQVRRWWAQWPDANLAIATGRGAGLVVLDVDPRHGGDESLSALESCYQSLPETVESLTGGGGRHLLFAHPGHPVGNQGGLAPGLDVRGDGGYIVAPPSLHTSGRRYAWEVMHHPDDTLLAPLPLWLLAVMRAAAAPAAPPAPGDGALAEGVRNVTLFRLACAMRRHGAPPAAIAVALAMTNQERCHPPLAPAEIQRIAGSAARYQPAAPGEGRGEFVDAWLGPRSHWHGVPLAVELVGDMR
jgi:hypothetical protein